MALLIGNKKKLQKIDEYMTTIMSYMKKYNNDDKDKAIRALGNYAFKFDLKQNFLYLYIGDEVILMKLNKDFTKFSSSAKKYKTEEQINAITYKFDVFMKSIENTIIESTPFGIAKNLTAIIDKIVKNECVYEELRKIPIDKSYSLEFDSVKRDKTYTKVCLIKKGNDTIIKYYPIIKVIDFLDKSIDKKTCDFLVEVITNNKVQEMIECYTKSRLIVSDIRSTLVKVNASSMSYGVEENSNIKLEYSKLIQGAGLVAKLIHKESLKLSINDILFLECYQSSLGVDFVINQPLLFCNYNNMCKLCEVLVEVKKSLEDKLDETYSIN